MMQAIADHLWQSTAFAGAVALLVWTLRDTRANVRYWLWLIASLKLLVPFAVLVSLGGLVSWRSSDPAFDANVTPLVDVVTQTLSAPLIEGAAAPARAASARFPLGSTITFAMLVVWPLGAVVALGHWWRGYRRIAALARRSSPAPDGSREIRILRALETASGVSRPLPVLHVDTSLEPGVFGAIRPVLLWPVGISERFTDGQITTILAHELCHVRRRDNLLSGLHALVQAAFWFHPLVWWLGARLVDERERACDEDVLLTGNEPQLYAESILKTCEFSIEGPIVHMAGVTGANLKQRIERIMRHHTGSTLTFGRKVLLATAGAAAMALPLFVGALTAPVSAQSSTAATADPKPAFEVTSVKPNTSTVPRITMVNRPGGVWEGTNMTLGMLVRMAYGIQDFQVVGGPAWLYDNRYDVLGKRPETTAPVANPQQQFLQMLQSLLEDRFKLRTHKETRDLPVYVLTLARRDGKLGPQLKASTADCQAIGRGRAAGPPPGAGARAGGPPPGAQMPPPGQRPECGMMGGRGTFQAGGIQLSQLVTRLSQDLGRVVVDKTGLTGAFDLDLKYTPEGAGRSDLPTAGAPPPPAADPDAPSVFTALEEQLGLKLESQRGPVEVLVIDNAEPPTEN